MVNAKIRLQSNRVCMSSQEGFKPANGCQRALWQQGIEIFICVVLRLKLRETGKTL